MDSSKTESQRKDQAACLSHDLKPHDCRSKHCADWAFIVKRCICPHLHIYMYICMQFETCMKCTRYLFVFYAKYIYMYISRHLNLRAM